MYIKVKVFPKTRKEEVKQVKPDKFDLHIRAEARRGEANLRVIELLRERFPEAKSIRIIKGQTTPNKLIELLGVEENLSLFE